MKPVSIVLITVLALVYTQTASWGYQTKATAKTPAKRYAYWILSVVVLFVLLVVKALFLCLIPKRHNRSRDCHLQKNAAEHTSAC
jgi:uncharacterized membrane protein